MPLLGAHVSIAKSIDLAFDRAKELGCETFQIFTRSPRMWKSSPISDEKATLFKQKQTQFNLGPVVVHMPYLPNLASSEKIQYRRSIKELTAEVSRASLLGCEMIVAHMGSHKGKGREKGLQQVIHAVQYALDHSPSDSSVQIVLENTAGYQNSIGDTFNDLAIVLNAIDDENRTGICFDTCHGYAAGYDLTDSSSVKATFAALDDIIGLERLRVLHMNDSKGALGCHKDRHEHIGMGHIGANGFHAILTHPRLQRLPMILETPADKRGNMTTNLTMLRQLMKI